MILCLLAFSLFGGSLHFSGSAAGPTPTPETLFTSLTPEPTPEPTTEPTPEPTPQVYTLSLIGDITPDCVSYFDGTNASYQNVVGTDYAYVFEKTLQYFENDDFTMANFECVLSDYDTAATKNFTFRASPDYAGILTDGSVEFVTLGNNHVLDFGEQGYTDTKAALDGAGVAYAGRDEYTVYTTQNGLVIGVYAASFGTESEIRDGIEALKNAGAEFIIAALHWGDEGSYDINEDQIAQGHAAIDAGADIVYGSHPHTLQPIEKYNGHYIFYSMGNWSFGGNTNPRDKDTFIARLTVQRDLDGTISVTALDIVPCASSGVTDGNNYQPVPYEDGSEEYDRTLSKLDGSFTGANLTIGYEYGFDEYASTN